MRPGRWVSLLPLSLGSFQLGHHRIVTYGKQRYSFVPHSHDILHFFLCFWTFVLFESSSFLSLWIFIQAPLSIASFCVRDVFNFHLTDVEELSANLYLYDSVLGFDRYCFLGVLILISLLDFEFSAWDHLYIIYCLPCFLSMGLLLSPPRTFLSVRWMEPRNSSPDLLISSYFTGIKQDFNAFISI